MVRRVAIGVVGAALALAACSGSAKPAHLANGSAAPTPTASSVTASGAAGTGAAGTGAAGTTAPATIPSSPAGVPPVSASSPAPVRPATLVWGKCSYPLPSGTAPLNRADQCSSLQVPLDYSNPGGSKITLAMIRLPSTGTKAQRVGSLLINPGGPGGSTIDSFDNPLTQELSTTLRQHFDVVGWDPRGVGHSTPAIACTQGAQADRLNADSPDITTAAGQAQLQADTQEEIKACVANSGAALLQHIGTTDAARDMDAIRIAVGDRKLSYLGYSYGTLLGATYASEFPANVRALVLDGAVDPSLDNVTGNEVQAAGFESSLKAFLADCQSRGSKCSWHPRGDLLTAFRSLMTSIAATSLPTQEKGRVLTSTLALNGVAASLYSRDSWMYLEEGLSSAASGDGTVLLELSDDLTDRSASGHYSNLDASLVAVDCKDDYQPSGLGPVMASYKRMLVSAPDFATFALSELECGEWPFKPTSQPKLVVNGAPPILVVGGTGDPATPLSEARGLSAALPGSRLLVRDGEGHTSYGSSSCVRAAADAYLLDPSVLPPVGKVCPSN